MTRLLFVTLIIFGVHAQAADKAPIPLKPISTPAGELRCHLGTVGPRVVILGCNGLTIKAMRTATLSPEALLGQLVSENGWSKTTLTVGGQKVPGALLEGAAGQGRTGVAVGGAHDGAPLALTCFGPAGGGTQAACRQVLAQFAGNGLPEGVVFAGASLSVAGRGLTVPAGCQLIEGHNRIRCAKAELHWRDVQSGCKGTPEQHREGFRSVLARAGRVTNSQSSCIVLGVEGDCDRWRLEVPGQAPVTIVTSMKGCGEPTLQCSVFGPLPASLPAPCDQVFGDAPAGRL